MTARQPMPKVPAVILAGGLAQRMGGGDKCLIELGGETLLSRAIERLTPQAGRLALNANGDASRFSDYGLPVLADTVAGHVGPLAGVLAAMEWADTLGADHVMTVAGDTPFFPADLAERLRAALTPASHEVSMAATRDHDGRLWRQPTFGLWPVALRDDLHTALLEGIRKVVVWADRHGVALAVFETGKIDPYFNINTAEDLEKARKMMAGAE